MFPAFCWHDLPGLIKACDYHINALPTPPVDGFRLPAPLHLVIRAHFSTEETAWTPGSTCPAGLCFLLLENPESTGRNRPAPSLPKTFPPICHGQGSGPWLGLLSSRWRPNSRPHAGRQVWPKLHYRYLITSPSQQESNPTGTSSFLLHFYSWGKFCPRRLWVNARCSPSPKFTKTPLIYGRLPTASTWQTQQPTQS